MRSKHGAPVPATRTRPTAEAIPRPSATRRRQCQPCRHCNTLLGKLHDPDCDYHQCLACTRQTMSCDREFEGNERKESEV